MRFDQLFQPVVDLAPDFPRHHRRERRIGHFEREIAGAVVAHVDDGHVRSFDLARTGQEFCNFLNRLLCRRETDAKRRPGTEGGQPLQRQRQMGSAFIGR